MDERTSLITDNMPSQSHTHFCLTKTEKCLVKVDFLVLGLVCGKQDREAPRRQLGYNKKQVSTLVFYALIFLANTHHNVLETIFRDI